jgi:hypothetical protein
LPRLALTACLIEVEEPFTATASVTVDVDSIGEITAIDADWPEEFPSELTQCLDQVLAKGEYNCPLSGSARVDFTVNITPNQ